MKPEEFVELGRGRGARVSRGARRAAGALVLPRRPAVRAGRREGRTRGADAPPVSWAAWRNPAIPTPSRPRRPRRKPPARRRPRSAAARSGRRSRCSARRTSGFCRYMIGAFVLIVGAVGRVGLLDGGFAMLMLIPLGVVLGALVALIIFGRRAQQSVYSKAEGQTGRGRVGAGQPARQVAGDARRRRHRPLRRGAPGDRPAGCDPRRRGIADPGQTAAGAGEEAHRPAGRRRSDLRRHRRQRRGPGAAVQAGART